ncbi:MAG: SDR family NAD(P)-dependent oxidoreductase [Chloroflexi bacterium]|nr:SDR family NAD(P)-dependent oxidoreductase [Chloroflexota bacterium]
MKDPICLITGATEGVGKATALELARKGFTIVVAARSAKKAALRKEIQASTSHASCDEILADLASLGQVRQLAETFRHRYPRLDVLINNAGVFLPTRTPTQNGYETMFQVNYLSPFLLTNLLLTELQNSEQGRIINLSSSVYTMGTFDPDTFSARRESAVLRAWHIRRDKAIHAHVHRTACQQTEGHIPHGERRASRRRPHAHDAASPRALAAGVLSFAAVFDLADLAGRGRPHVGICGLRPGASRGLRAVLCEIQAGSGEEQLRHGGQPNTPLGPE